MGGFDTNSVLGAGGLSTALALIAYPLWRKFLAKTTAETTLATGETSWIKQQSEDLATSKLLIAELMKLRAADAEIIAGMRLERALAKERNARMTVRMNRMETMLIAMRPEFREWIASDFTSLPDITPERAP